MQITDLTEKSKHHERAAISQTFEEPNATRFIAGEIIEFWAGYNDDIRFRAKIAGISGDDIYLVWDCYWSPIRDDSRRKITKTEGA